MVILLSKWPDSIWWTHRVPIHSMLDKSVNSWESHKVPGPELDVAPKWTYFWSSQLSSSYPFCL